MSSLPLNERDFSKLLLLAAGTMTDTNGAANFTQQFAVNGQRGVAAVFAIDGADTTDPELGGATFSNFNVDAIQEVQSSSGVMPAEIGHGAAGFTNVITKSGSNQVHGSAFEFVRNAAFDARNFFDHTSEIDPRRIPPFARNEFGVTNGGPVVLPGLYDGRGKTFYFGEYQGFRQVLGTTQVFSVPTAAERQGIDTTTFPGDTLTVPVSPAIAPLLARYPLPNEPQGPYGPRTYAASSKVVTNTDQFSVRSRSQDFGQGDTVYALQPESGERSVMRPVGDIGTRGAADVHHRVVNRIADRSDILFEARAVVPTTQGLTSATPRAGRIKMQPTKRPSGTALRIGASHEAPIEPIRKYAPARIKYASERARRKPKRSAMAPPKIARNHTMPPNIPVSVPVCSVEKLSFSCR